MNKKLYYVWNLGLLLCLLPFVLLAIRNSSSIHDDYMDANSILKLGVYGYIKVHYLHWTGRYTELLLKAVLNPLIYKNSKLVACASTVIIIGLVFFSIYALCRLFVGKAQLLQISLLLMVVFLCGLTDVGSFLYWYGGYTAYTLGVVFSLIYLVFLCKLKKTYSLLYLLACALLIILASGSYEVVTMAVLWVTLTNVAYSIIRKEGLMHSLILGVVSVVSAAFVVLAPGNYARISGINAEAADMSVSRIVISVCKSMFFAAGSMMAWVNSVLLLLGMLLVIQALCDNEQIKRIYFNSNPVLVYLWLFIGISVSIFPSVAVYQAVWLHSWQSVYPFFLIGWVVFCISLFSYIDAKYNIRMLLLNQNFVWVTRVIFFAIALMSSSSNVHIAYWDLLYLSEYEQRVENRIIAMKSAASENRAAELKPLFSNSEKYLIPQTLYTEEYNEGDAQAFANYYGVDSVRVNRCHLQ